LEELIRTPTMKKLLYSHQQRIKELLERLEPLHLFIQNNGIRTEAP
jgi:hypothetical protein